MQEILNNEGENQLMDVFDSYIEAAERALEDAMDAAIYGDGTANGGKQLTGLATAIPIVTNYRHLWRHRSRHQRDLANHDLRRAYRCCGYCTRGIGTQVNIDHDPADAQLRHDPAVPRPVTMPTC